MGRADNEVAVGDIVDMLLSISLACKDAMLDWSWLGIDMQEWPHQRLDWEMCRLERLAYARNMETSLEDWLRYSWHIGYRALRCLACQTGKFSTCVQSVASLKATRQEEVYPWAYISRCLEHLLHGSAFLGSLLNSESPATTGESMNCSRVVS